MRLVTNNIRRRENTTCCANGGVSNNKKVARNLRTNLNTFTEWKAKITKQTMYVPHCRVDMYYVVLLLPVPEEYLLHFPLCPKRVVVRVKEHDRSSRVWLSEREGFHRMLFNGSLLH